MSARPDRSFPRLLQGAVCSIAWCIAAAAVALPPGEGAFGAARTLPGDVALAVRVRGLEALRADATLASVRAALERVVGSRELGAAWERFAADLGLEGPALAERLMGQDAVYAERTRGGAVEWVAIVRSEQAMHDLMVSRLRPAVGVGGRCVYPAQRIATSWRPPFLLIGGSDRAGLLDETVARFDAADPAGSLAASPDLAPVLGWQPWPVEVVLRHDLPIGGLTAFAARPDDGVLRVRHRSRFDRAPIHVAPGVAADEAVLRAVGERHLAAFSLNPWRGALDASEPLDAVLIEGGFDESMRANLGARQVALVGDSAVRGTRLRAPTVAVAFEVRDPLLAARQWDAWARRLAESVARRAGLQVAAAAAEGAGGLRTIDLAPALRTLTDDHPFVRDLRVCWVQASGPGGRWHVMGSDASLVAELADAVARSGRAPDPRGANELASISGQALAAHLRSWLTDPSLLVRGPAEEFAQAAATAAELAAAAPRVRWRARGSDDGVIESEIEVELRAEPARAVSR